MEPRFRRTLDTYSNLAKQSAKVGGKDGQILDKEIKEAIDSVAGSRMMEVADQEKIFLIQQQKQRVMHWLHERLHEVDTGKQMFEPKARPIKQVAGKLLWAHTDGTYTEVTIGMLLSDGIWDIEYALDPETVPRILRKKYFIEQARHILQRELDKQIAIDKQQSELSDLRYRRGYNGLVRNRKELDTRGHLAERMVYSFFRKVTQDHDLPFKIVASNVYEDLELKIDFIIIIKARSRGVSIASDEKAQTIGIQFTLARRRVHKHKKVQQAKEHAKYIGLPIDDIVIVKMPIKKLFKTFSAWSANKPPGGPDEFWDNGVKEKLFKKILKDLFKPHEIDSMWEQIQTIKNP